MKKPNERALRFKYIRVLEKFVKRIIALVKHDDFDYEIFKKKIIENYKFIKDVESIRLDSEYMKKLKNYAQITLDMIDNHSEDFEKEKQLLLKEANLLHKEKNKTNYKKDKHIKKSFTDGY